MTIPQVVGMYKNDRTRKEILVDFGFRLPSALDNRPLTFEEFEATVNQAVYMSATPGRTSSSAARPSSSSSSGRPASSIPRSPSARPRARSTTSSRRSASRVQRGERALVTTLTKKMAEDLADYLKELGVKVQYLHSEVDTLERVAILRDLRLGVFDVLVGINLLREGIDLPEVTLVAILDADKEGFLRSAWSLIQMIGRAARNISGTVIMYADTVTESMRVAIEETDRRRSTQIAYNVEHNIEPTTIVKGIRDLNERLRAVAESTVVYSSERPGEFSDADRAKVEALVARMEAEMRAAAKQLEFERAAAIRDEIQQIRLRVLQEDASIRVGRAAERAPAANGWTARTARRRGRQARNDGLTGPRIALAAAELSRPRSPQDRRWRSRASRCCPPTRSRATRSVNRASTRTPSPIGCPGSATSTRTTAAGRPAGSIDRPGTGPSRRISASGPASDRDVAGTRRRISRTAKPRHTPGVRRCPALAALLVVGIVASGCSAERTATAVGDHGGLDLQLELSSTNGVLVARTVVRNTRAHPISLDADQCGASPTSSSPARRSSRRARRRRGPSPRSRNHPRRSAISRGSGAVPPRTLGGSEVPRVPTPGPAGVVGSRGIHRRTPRTDDRRVEWLAAVGSANTTVRAEAVEAVASDGSPSSTACPRARRRATGRSQRHVEIPTSSVLELAPTRPNVGPSLGQVFDRIVENNRLRAFIEAQPPGSWRDAGLRVAEHGSGLLFRAVTTMFERPATATIAGDGSDVGDLVLPGDADRARVFDRRPATLPPGIGVIPDQSGAETPRTSLPDGSRSPSGQLVADGSSPADRSRCRTLPPRVVHGVRDARPLSRLVGRERRARDRRGLGRAHGRLEARIHGRGRWRHCRIHPVEGSDALGQMIRRSVGLGGVPAGGLRLADGA